MQGGQLLYLGPTVKLELPFSSASCLFISVTVCYHPSSTFPHMQSLVYVVEIALKNLTSSGNPTFRLFQVLVLSVLRIGLSKNW